MRLRDKFWLWGHPEGCFNNAWGNTGISRMTPMEGCLYLGVRNTFMTPVDVDVNRRQYNKSFTTLDGVVWECFDAGNNPCVVDPLIREAADFPNINGAVFDDFQRGGVDEYTKIPLENLWTVREKLHNNDVRQLNMWMVLYTHEFATNAKGPAGETYDDEIFMSYIEPFDGIIMWNWYERNVEGIPGKFAAFKELTKGKRRMVGCYLWNFGEKKAATGAAVKKQLDWYRQWLMDGEIEGVVLHTNTMADLDLEAYDVAVAWMQEHGDEQLPENC